MSMRESSGEGSSILLRGLWQVPEGPGFASLAEFCVSVTHGASAGILQQENKSLLDGLNVNITD
jgi:hypothetical protein